jgi:hypothetical protein
MRTLHPQWGGYSYLWQRDLNTIEPSQFERGEDRREVWLTSPFAFLVAQAQIRSGHPDPWLHLRRRLTGPEALLDFPVLEGRRLTRNRHRLFFCDRSPGGFQ